MFCDHSCWHWSAACHSTASWARHTWKQMAAPSSQLCDSKVVKTRTSQKQHHKIFPKHNSRRICVDRGVWKTPGPRSRWQVALRTRATLYQQALGSIWSRKGRLPKATAKKVDHSYLYLLQRTVLQAFSIHVSFGDCWRANEFSVS